MYNAFHRLSLPERLFTCVLAIGRVFILGYHFVHFLHIQLLRTRLAELQTGCFMSWISSQLLANWHSGFFCFPESESRGGSRPKASVDLRKSLWPFATRRVCRVCGVLDSCLNMTSMASKVGVQDCSRKKVSCCSRGLKSTPGLISSVCLIEGAPRKTINCYIEKLRTTLEKRECLLIWVHIGFL